MGCPLLVRWHFCIVLKSWCSFHLWNEPTLCWIYFRKHKVIFQFWIILQPWDDIDSWNYFLKEGKIWYLLLCQYHGYWCSCDTRSQGIHRHAINLVSQNILLSVQEGLTSISDSVLLWFCHNAICNEVMSILFTYGFIITICLQDVFDLSIIIS